MAGPPVGAQKQDLITPITLDHVMPLLAQKASGNGIWRSNRLGSVILAVWKSKNIMSVWAAVRAYRSGRAFAKRQIAQTISTSW